MLISNFSNCDLRFSSVQVDNFPSKVKSTSCSKFFAQLSYNLVYHIQRWHNSHIEKLSQLQDTCVDKEIRQKGTTKLSTRQNKTRLKWTRQKITRQQLSKQRGFWKKVTSQNELQTQVNYTKGNLTKETKTTGNYKKMILTKGNRPKSKRIYRWIRQTATIDKREPGNRELFKTDQGVIRLDTIDKTKGNNTYWKSSWLLNKGEVDSKM